MSLKVRRTRYRLERMEPRVLLSTYTVVNTSEMPIRDRSRWAILQVNKDTGP